MGAKCYIEQMMLLYAMKALGASSHPFAQYHALDEETLHFLPMRKFIKIMHRQANGGVIVNASFDSGHAAF